MNRELELKQMHINSLESILKRKEEDINNVYTVNSRHQMGDSPNNHQTAERLIPSFSNHYQDQIGNRKIQIMENLDAHPRADLTSTDSSQIRNKAKSAMNEGKPTFKEINNEIFQYVPGKAVSLGTSSKEVEEIIAYDKKYFANEASSSPLGQELNDTPNYTSDFNIFKQNLSDLQTKSKHGSAKIIKRGNAS